MPELEEISEVIWFNLSSHLRDGAAEAEGGEVVAGLSSRTCKKLVWCSFHNTSGSQTARENGLQCLCTHRLRGIIAKFLHQRLWVGSGNLHFWQVLRRFRNYWSGAALRTTRLCRVDFHDSLRNVSLFVETVLIKTIPSAKEFIGNPIF